MSDLIRRDDAIRELSGACSNWEDDAKVADIINGLPSAEGGDAEMNEVKSPYMQSSPDGADLISRADAIEAVTDIQDGSGQRYYLAVSLVDKIRSLPSADITETEECQKCQETTERVLLNKASAEAVQGEWQMCEDFDGEYGICSVCGEDADFSHYGTPYNFCPNCGAKMKGGDDE